MYLKNKSFYIIVILFTIINKREYNQRYYKKHKKRLLDSIHEYRRNNPEKVKMSNKKWRDNNKEHEKQRHKKWRMDNPDYDKERWQKRYDIINPYRDRPCQICNGHYPLVAMDFHYLDKSNKIKEVTGMIGSPNKYSIKQIITEIKKCMIICANCHWKIHNKFEYLKYPKWFIQYKLNLNCAHCSFKDALEFHHIDRTKKIDKISDMIRKYTKEIVLNEIKKCKVLCRCCHRVVESNLRLFV